ncbi:hypothetical protein ACFY4C_21015 [Actinomadura viridis]|uniref:hypothetical protein n=1 Tax=Actinomadura viridis TaxID=58110 RepID=UPI003689155F
MTNTREPLNLRDDRRTPGIPGTLGDLQWVDSPDYGEDPRNRRIPKVYDVNPAPLARMLAAALHITGDDVTDRMRELADDERDGPIHLVHLLGACEYAAQQTGGGLPGSGAPAGTPTTLAITETVSGDPITQLVNALRQGGFPAATQKARDLGAENRYRILDVLIHFWMGPITGLCIDLTDAQLRRQ